MEKPDAYSRFDRRTLSIAFLISVSFLLLDIAIGSLVDVYHDFTTSVAGISLYLATTTVLMYSLHLMLKMATAKLSTERAPGLNQDTKIAKVVLGVFYSMIGINGFVLFEIGFYSEYHTGLLAVASAINVSSPGSVLKPNYLSKSCRDIFHRDRRRSRRTTRLVRAFLSDYQRPSAPRRTNHRLESPLFGPCACSR